MRLTRRYRVVKPVRFFFWVLALVLAVTLSISALFSSSTEAASAETYRQVSVHENESIWNIAQEYCNDGKDTSVHVNEICEINDVEPGDVQAGDVLIVPVAE